MTSKELEQIIKIEKSYNVSQTIEVDGYRCAVIAYHVDYVEVIPFDENTIYPKQRAYLKWSFVVD